MLFDFPKEQSSIIKVIGVGGGGSNAVNYMFAQGIRGVSFIICNTDAQAMELSPVPCKIQLGPFLTEGLGAGSDPDIGRRAAEESIEDIRKILEKNTRMVFVTAGMGGGTGTGGAPVIARVAKELGILTVGIVTTPFSFEGKRKIKHAEEGIQAMRQNVDSLIVISNDKIREIYGNLARSEAFGKADNILTTAAKSISEIITVPGQINVDFADVQHVMKNSGVAIMGSFVAEGEQRALRAVEGALNSPLLNDNNIRGAKKVLINITTGTLEPTIDEIDQINNYVQDAAGNEADVIFGTCDDHTLGEKISVTVIATGFESTSRTCLIPPQKELTNRPAVNEQKIVVPLHEETNTGQNLAEEHETIAFEEKNNITSSQLPFTESITSTGAEEKSATVEKGNSERVGASETTDTTGANTYEIELEIPSATYTVEEALQYAQQQEATPNDLFSDYKVVVRNETETSLRTENTDSNSKSSVPERLRHLSDLSMKINNPGNLNEIEQVPAYKRKSISLDMEPPSSQHPVSDYTITTDGNKIELRRNNSFLHDNVD